MRNLILAVISLWCAIVPVRDAHAEADRGANSDGTEKVCFFGASAQNDQILEDVLKKCRRGDILDIGWLSSPVAMQLCDFTKAIIYHPTKGSVIACVYTGTRRNVIK